MNDFDVIRQIERELNIELRLLDRIRWNIQGYTLNQNGDVVGLGLRNLHMDNNKLYAVIPFIEKLKKLSELNLVGNHINDISPFKDLTYLNSLSLGENQINDISLLRNLSNISILFLDNNKIVDISLLKYFKNLTGLYLHNNQIVDLSSLKDLNKLHTLALGDNPIKELPSWITNFDMEIKWGSWEDGVLTINSIF
ncbi:MAG: leucine-rich repeat domain-containing protein [bacterium]